MVKKIAYTKPSITELEIQYANDAVKNGWGEKCYDYIKLFEKEFTNYLGSNHGIATSSCTGALHMGLCALGIGPGDEVIMANTNWIATAAPVSHLGAKVVLVDILPESWCINPTQIEKAISKKTKAIIVTHLYGNLCEMNEIMSIGNQYGIPIIEDSAEAIGSIYEGKKAGSIGTFGVFSFHGTKTLTTGEGGILVTNDNDLYERVLCLSNHGRSLTETRQFWPERFGFKYKMSNVEAAIGCAQLKRIDELIKQKRDIFDNYRRFFNEIDFRMNLEKSNTVNGYWMPTIEAINSSKFQIPEIIQKLKGNNIDARVFFWPLSSLGLRGLEKAFDTKYLSEEIHLRAINLPSPFDLTEDDCETISNIILNS